MWPWHVKMPTQNLLRLLLMLRNVLTIAWKFKFGHKVKISQKTAFLHWSRAGLHSGSSGCLFVWSFVLVSPCQNDPIHRKIVVDCPTVFTVHIQGETLFQARLDQERGINGTASLLHSWQWVLLPKWLPWYLWLPLMWNMKSRSAHILHLSFVERRLGQARLRKRRRFRIQN